MTSPQPKLRRSTQGVRVVAVLEAAKAAIVVIAGLGLLVVVHEGAARLIDELARHMHLNPANNEPRIFVDLARDVSNERLRLLAAGAFVYSLLRGFEAWGLWHRRRWALWLSVASGAIYVPFEVYEMAHGFSGLKLGMLLLNLGIVAYMAVELHLSRERRRRVHSRS